ncbi:hypothetical protein ACLOJK_029221 [Asimina triloba]
MGEHPSTVAGGGYYSYDGVINADDVAHRRGSGAGGRCCRAEAGVDGGVVDDGIDRSTQWRQAAAAMRAEMTIDGRCIGLTDNNGWPGLYDPSICGCLRGWAVAGSSVGNGSQASRGGDIGGRHGVGGAAASGYRSKPDERPGSIDSGLASDRDDGRCIWGETMKMLGTASVMIDDWIKSIKVGHKILDYMMVWVRSANGDDGSGMKAHSSATEEDSLQVVVVINTVAVNGDEEAMGDGEGDVVVATVAIERWLSGS